MFSKERLESVMLEQGVKNYDELLSSMQHDKNFERLIMAMTIDRVAGISSLLKGKSNR